MEERDCIWLRVSTRFVLLLFPAPFLLNYLSITSILLNLTVSRVSLPFFSASSHPPDKLLRASEIDVPVGSSFVNHFHVAFLAHFTESLTRSFERRVLRVERVTAGEVEDGGERSSSGSNDFFEVL